MSSATEETIPSSVNKQHKISLYGELEKEKKILNSSQGDRVNQYKGQK